MPANPFVWYELLTDDAAAASAFYSKVVGWQIRDSGMPGMSYNLLSAGGADIGGLMGMPPEQCAAWDGPGWLGYIGVQDVDVMQDKVKAAGGQIMRPADDIPGIGRFAVAADNQGAPFILFTPKSHGGNDASPSASAPGRIGWHSLFAGDSKAALDFYAGLFGWTQTEEMDCGPMGIYRLFATGGEEPVGGMMGTPAGKASPSWLFYINVEDIDAAHQRITDAGGTVTMGPDPVPNEGWIIHAKDPQGAAFAVSGPRKK